MTAYAAGQILFGDEGRMHIRIWDGQYYLCNKDLGILFFVGGDIPVLVPGPDGGTTPHVSGSARLGPSGQAVLLTIGGHRFMIPRERFLAVAFGEEASCIFSEMPADPSSAGTTPPRTGGKKK